MSRLLDYFHLACRQAGHLLVPKEENNFRSKALHIDFLTYYLIFALFLSFGFKKFSFNNVLGFATDITVDRLYTLTNEQRHSQGLGNLSYNDKLAAAAYQKAQDMFAKNYWAHYGPDGTSPWNFILGSGYKYEYAGENLAKNFLFSQGVVDAWMNSQTHRDNILRSEYSEVGFAVVNGVLNGEETTLVVQMFGKPLTSTVASSQPPASPESKEMAPQAATAQETDVGQPKILAKQASTAKINASRLSYNINFVFIAFLALALLMDLYFSVKFKVIRISGKNIAHLIFITFIVLGLTLFVRGTII